MQADLSGGAGGRSSSAARQRGEAGAAPRRYLPHALWSHRVSARDRAHGKAPLRPTPLASDMPDGLPFAEDSRRRLRRMQNMHVLYRSAERRECLQPLTNDLLLTRDRDAASDDAQLNKLAALSLALDAAEVTPEDAFEVVLSLRPFSRSPNAWVEMQARLAARPDLSTSIFDLLWFARAQEEFDAPDFTAHEGAWGRVYAELLLRRYLLDGAGEVDAVQRLSHCHELIREAITSISVSGAPVTTEQVRRLAWLCPNLVELDVSATPVGEAAIAHVMKACRRLERINIAETRLQGDTVSALLSTYGPQLELIV